MICPPVDAEASTAPAKLGLKPDRLITGIVMTPVDTTFDIAMAGNAGVRGIGVAWGYPPVEELHRCGAHSVAQDSSELSRAIHQFLG